MSLALEEMCYDRTRGQQPQSCIRPELQQCAELWLHPLQVPQLLLKPLEHPGVLSFTMTPEYSAIMGLRLMCNNAA